LSWADIRKIIATENNCFVLSGDQVEKITAFSEYTNRAYTLMPTPRAPTLLISGLPMHRIKDTTPDKDTLEKVKAIKPLFGLVLDTSTGLGYTAIQAARTADEVITIELDPAVLEIGRLNPWSRELFDNPKILQRIGDSREVVEEFEDDSFNHVIHDPPTISLAGHLYGVEFYRELHRIIKSGGRLFHYIGDPDSRSGRRITRGVVQRLEDAGFSRIQHSKRAFGVVAYKSS